MTVDINKSTPYHSVYVPFLPLKSDNFYSKLFMIKFVCFQFPNKVAIANVLGHKIHYKYFIVLP